MKRTGHKEVCFPLLIPEALFQLEAEHIKGFDSQVYWVTHAGKNKLEERLLLRPTSETAIYSVFPLWIRSHADLPLKTYQIVNTFRYETKMTKAFLRVREIHFFEAHTCHSDFEDAENQIKEDIKIVKRFLSKLCLPHLLSRRPPWDKFAGADYSIGIDTLLPSKKAIQLGSLQQYKDNFSRPFKIKYEDENGAHRYCHQTTYGMSERLLGAIIGVHGDDKGIVLPPAIAPIQVVIVPIVFKGKEKSILEYCRQVFQRIQNVGIRVHLDERDMNPGSKYYDWELKGVPIRLEIGPRDIEKGVITIVNRYGEKNEIPAENIEMIPEELLRFGEQLLHKAQQKLEGEIHILYDIKSFKEGIIEIPWCEKESCGLELEERLEKKTLGTPIPSKTAEGECPICDKKATTWIRLANTY
jgi:prolyl-tRNA synthetase